LRPKSAPKACQNHVKNAQKQPVFKEKLQIYPDDPLSFVRLQADHFTPSAMSPDFVAPQTLNPQVFVGFK
jgi:hypothetical protein